MDIKDQTLEEEIEKSDVVRCNYCNKELKKEEAWYSHNGLPYCNMYCFNLFTED